MDNSARQGNEGVNGRRRREYSKIINARGGGGEVGKTYFMFTCDTVRSTSKVNKSTFVYTEIHAIVQASLMDTANVGL